MKGQKRKAEEEPLGLVQEQEIPDMPMPAFSEESTCLRTPVLADGCMAGCAFTFAAACHTSTQQVVPVGTCAYGLAWICSFVKQQQ